MLSRRAFLKSTLGTGVALAARFSPEAAAQPARRRLVVDAQVHMWKASTPDRPWVPGARAQLPEPFTIERLVQLNSVDVEGETFRGLFTHTAVARLLQIKMALGV